MKFGNHELVGSKHHLNEQWLARFPNGYGASVIRGPYTYGGESGLWELGVIRYEGKGFKLTYDTPVTDDVIGRLTDAEVADLLTQIEALPAKEAS